MTWHAWLLIGAAAYVATVLFVLALCKAAGMAERNG